METNQIDWKDDNNVRIYFEGNPETSISFTLDDINQFKEVINVKNTRFIHIGKDTSINIEKVKYVIYKN